jgi:flagellar protein FlbD
MILVQRLNGEEIIINAELIETIEKCPDTLISLTSGKKFLVLDSAEDIIDKVIVYRRRVYNSAPIHSIVSEADKEPSLIE